jgi:hypothetical protein
MRCSMTSAPSAARLWHQLPCTASQIKSPVISMARVLYMLTPFRVPDAREWPHDWLMLRRVEPHNVFRRVWHPGSRGSATNPKRCANVDDIIGRKRPMMVTYFRIIVSKVYLSQPFSINIMSDRIAAMPRAAIISMIYPLTGADILRTPVSLLHSTRMSNQTASTSEASDPSRIHSQRYRIGR